MKRYQKVFIGLAAIIVVAIIVYWLSNKIQLIGTNNTHSVNIEEPASQEKLNDEVILEIGKARYRLPRANVELSPMGYTKEPKPGTKDIYSDDSFLIEGNFFYDRDQRECNFNNVQPFILGKWDDPVFQIYCGFTSTVKIDNRGCKFFDFYLSGYTEDHTIADKLANRQFKEVGHRYDSKRKVNTDIYYAARWEGVPCNLVVMSWEVDNENGSGKYVGAHINFFIKDNLKVRLTLFRTKSVKAWNKYLEGYIEFLRRADITEEGK